MSIGAQAERSAAGEGILAHPAWTRWGAHVAFWLMYLFIRSAAAGADPPDDMSDFPYLVNRALVVTTYFVLTGILLALIAGPRADKSNWVRNISLVVGALALGPVTQYAEEFWPMMLAGFSPDSYPFVIYLFQFGWALPLWGLTQALLGYHFQSMAQARAVARAQALAYDAQLKMLHYQINPHFLFNTLNAISTLVLEKRNDQEGVPLPSLILQPIMENAIKYAISPRTEGGSIDVSAFRDGDLLRIRIDDDGPGLSPEGDPRRRRGVGLANARERLELIYGERAGLSAQNRAPNGCRVEIWLPLEEQSVGRTPAPALS
jgi:hypothetical protein